MIRVASRVLVGVMVATLLGLGPSSAGAGAGRCVPVVPSDPHTTPVKSPHRAYRRADVWVYGDSITYQTFRHLRSRMPGHRLAVDAWWGRGSSTAVAALGRDVHRYGYRHGHWPRTVVIATGTNDLADPAGFARQVRLARAVLPARVRLVWVDVYVTTTPAFNVADAALDQVPGVRVVRWAAANRTARVRLLLDGIHVNGAGCEVRNRLIRAAVTR